MIAENTVDTLPPVVSSSSSSLPTLSSSSVAFTSSSAASSEAPAILESSSSSSKSGVVKKGVSTKKASGINVEEVLAKLQLVTQQTNEASFVQLTAPDASKVKTYVLLRNNDRAFLFSWMESDDVKSIFAGLKQALQEQFSGKVTDLIDETRSQAGGPPVDYLTFKDPALSAERIVFLRVRTRLYEIHIAANGEALVDQLVTELSK
ncbi:MAG: hypothetical protein ABL879_19115 [Devosia sp.]